MDNHTAGQLAPLLGLQRAKLSDFDLPADIKLPRAIDPFGEDEPLEQLPCAPTTEEAS